MSFRGVGGGRDRMRREYSSRSDGNSLGRASNPPSRHLWVGNLSHSLVERDLTDHFLRFGELESVAFQPGRSYAFINFDRDHDAIAAMKALQGFPVAGNPLRIEFAKAGRSVFAAGYELFASKLCLDKSSAPRSEDHNRHDEPRASVRASPFSQKDSRGRHASPDHSNPEKSRMSDRSSEASEVLWIGFPALLKVDEVILRKAFSPFGEIEKITVFPGRSYAFVRFRSIISACRAKETLQGKLFGNPRVHICFAKSESGSSNSGRSSTSAPLTPHFKSNGRLGSSDNFHHDRNYGSTLGDPSIRSPRLIPDVNSSDPDVYNYNRKGPLWSEDDENWRFGEVGPEPVLPQDIYERHSSPRERVSLVHDFPQKFPQKNPFYEEHWDLPDDAYYHHGVKKLKTSAFLPEKELPEYPFSKPEQEKHALPRVFSDFPQNEAVDKSFNSGPFGYKQILDLPVSLALPHGERSDHLRAPYDNFQAGSALVPSNTVERKRFTPELDQASLNDWKWEGTIAKGGTPVCRARCFPVAVGKALDIMLPEFLDCTARTGLDMLAKHYYQASSAWVVFFVPESDADIGFYNEFMHYLGEKQRAAVAKLDEKTTLFLVPPSDFSEKVLKVPGKLSISGVILRLDHPGSSFGSVPQPNDYRDGNLLTYHGDTTYTKPSAPSGSFPPITSIPDLIKAGINDLSFVGNLTMPAPSASFSGSLNGIGNVSDSYVENRHDHPPPQRLGPNWSPHDLRNSISSARNIPSQVSSNAVDPAVFSVIPRLVQEMSSGHHGSVISGIPLSGPSKSSIEETKHSIPLSLPITGLQPEQLAQLASSLLGQPRQVGSTPNVSMGEELKQMNRMNQSDNLYKPQDRYAFQSNQVTPEFLPSQFGQVQHLQLLQQQQQQQLQHVSNVSATMTPPAKKDHQSLPSGNQQPQSSVTQDETDSDPQKRLQATLQLAAALLQQIQQGKGT